MAARHMVATKAKAADVVGSSLVGAELTDALECIKPETLVRMASPSFRSPAPEVSVFSRLTGPRAAPRRRKGRSPSPEYEGPNRPARPQAASQLTPAVDSAALARRRRVEVAASTAAQPSQPSKAAGRPPAVVSSAAASSATADSRGGALVLSRLSAAEHFAVQHVTIAAEDGVILVGRRPRGQKRHLPLRGARITLEKADGSPAVFIQAPGAMSPAAFCFQNYPEAREWFAEVQAASVREAAGPTSSASLPVSVDSMEPFGAEARSEDNIDACELLAVRLVEDAFVEPAQFDMAEDAFVEPMAEEAVVEPAQLDMAEDAFVELGQFDLAEENVLEEALVEPGQFDVAEEDFVEGEVVEDACCGSPSTLDACHETAPARRTRSKDVAAAQDAVRWATAAANAVAAAHPRPPSTDESETAGCEADRLAGQLSRMAGVFAAAAEQTRSRREPPAALPDSCPEPKDFAMLGIEAEADSLAQLLKIPQVESAADVEAAADAMLRYLRAAYSDKGRQDPQLGRAEALSQPQTTGGSEDLSTVVSRLKREAGVLIPSLSSPRGMIGPLDDSWAGPPVEVNEEEEEEESRGLDDGLATSEGTGTAATEPPVDAEMIPDSPLGHAVFVEDAFAEVAPQFDSRDELVGAFVVEESQEGFGKVAPNGSSHWSLPKVVPLDSRPTTEENGSRTRFISACFGDVPDGSTVPSTSTAASPEVLVAGGAAVDPEGDSKRPVGLQDLFLPASSAASAASLAPAVVQATSTGAEPSLVQAQRQVAKQLADLSRLLTVADKAESALLHGGADEENAGLRQECDELRGQLSALRQHVSAQAATFVQMIDKAPPSTGYRCKASGQTFAPAHLASAASELAPTLPPSPRGEEFSFGGMPGAATPGTAALARRGEFSAILAAAGRPPSPSPMLPGAAAAMASPLTPRRLAACPGLAASTEMCLPPPQYSRPGTGGAVLTLPVSPQPPLPGVGSTSAAPLQPALTPRGVGSSSAAPLQPALTPTHPAGYACSAGSTSAAPLGTCYQGGCTAGSTSAAPLPDARLAAPLAPLATCYQGSLTSAGSCSAPSLVAAYAPIALGWSSGGVGSTSTRSLAGAGSLRAASPPVRGMAPAAAGCATARPAPRATSPPLGRSVSPPAAQGRPGCSPQQVPGLRCASPPPSVGFQPAPGTSPPGMWRFGPEVPAAEFAPVPATRPRPCVGNFTASPLRAAPPRVPDRGQVTPRAAEACR